MKKKRLGYQAAHSWCVSCPECLVLCPEAAGIHLVQEDDHLARHVQQVFVLQGPIEVTLLLLIPPALRQASVVDPHAADVRAILEQILKSFQFRTLLISDKYRTTCGS